MEIVVRASSLRLVRNARPVLADVDWTVRRGDRWALWGPNGSGKSTLLELLAGLRSADDGTVRRLPAARVALVAQQPRLPTVDTLGALVAVGLPALRKAERALRDEERRLAGGEGDLDRYAELQEAFERAGGYRGEARLRRELATLLPDRTASDPLATLSSGERRRAALALAFAARPDLLLLDEPSNGLDVGMRRWLARRLGALPSQVALVVTSHDRDLLARVGNGSARLADGRLEAKRLRFDVDRAERGTITRSAVARRQRALREAARLSSAADQARRHGSPARTAAARVLDRRAAAEAAAAEALAGSLPVTATLPTATLATRSDVRGPLLWSRGLSLPGHFDDLALEVAAGDKIAILGANASGKSGLLRMLAAEQRGGRPDSEVWLRPGARLLYWDASRRGLAHEPLAQQLLRWVSTERVDSLLALVGLAHAQRQALPRELSGGERARAALALLLAAEPDLVLLDEPEQDLDLPAIELLEQALVDTRTTVVLVTHDLRLAEAVADDVRSLDGGRLRAWRGGVAGWRAGRARREEGACAATDARVADGDATAEPMGARVEARPQDPTVLEDEQAAIDALLEDPTHLTARQQLRLAMRRDRLIVARMEAYDSALPSPAPRYRASEPPLLLYADRDGDTLTFRADGWPSRPSMLRSGPIAHLVLPDPPGASWTPWARAAALRACLALAFPLLAPQAVQTRAAPFPAPEPFMTLDGSWWVAPRSAWERFAGFGRAVERRS